MPRPYNRIKGEFKAPTEFLIAAELRRLEKQDACGHIELYANADGQHITCCYCGKTFNDDELDELDWERESLDTGEISVVE